MKQYIGVDLHSNNIVAASIDEQGKRLLSKKIVNDRNLIIEFFEAIGKKGEIISIGIESTYNYYWLVDLLEDEGYEVRVGHPAAMEPYRGMKHQNDKSDAFFLADLLRVNNFPDCWICPREGRPLRDLLRARLKLVQKRTDMKNTLTAISSRYLGTKYSADKLNKMTEDEIELLFYYEQKQHLIIRIMCELELIRTINKIIKSYEEIVIAELKKGEEFELIKSVPGIGDILAMTILLETGDISRFKKAGNYTSYCRCVDSSRTSNGKSKGSGNTKNGSKYLKWAFTEAAQRCRQWSDPAKAYYQRKAAKSNNSVATVATSAKLSKAVFYILRNKEPFDVNKCFV